MSKIVITLTLDGTSEALREAARELGTVASIVDDYGMDTVLGLQGGEAYAGRIFDEHLVTCGRITVAGAR
jgi:hypothetical protein